MIMKYKSFPLLFFTAYTLLIAITPILGTIDKIYPQFLIGGIVSLLHLIYNFRKGYIKLNLPPPIYLISLLLLLAFISIFLSLNHIAAIIDFTHFFVTCSILINCYFTLKNESDLIDSIFLIITITLSFEVIAVMLSFIEFFNLSVIEKIGRAPIYNGLAGNINISAFSILMKSMFLMYYINRTTKKLKKLLLYALMILCFFSIALTGSRGALLAIWFTLFLFISIYTYKYFRYKDRAYIQKTLIYIIPFTISTVITELIFNTLRVSYRTQEIFNRGSTSRIEYWSDAIQGIMDYPFGLGIGNWKIFSIHYASDYMRSYVVPYHAHNDLLQFFVESGVIAGLILVITMVIVYWSVLKDSLKNKMNNDISIYILMFLSVYFIDSLLNFPISRPIQVFTFAVVLSIISVKYFNANFKHYYKVTFSVFFIMLISATYVNIRVYNSSVEQLNLFRDFNLNSFDDSIEEIDSYEDKLPNITVTTFPIKSLKALYYYSNGDTINAIKILKDNIKMNENPFIGLNEAKLSKIYNDQREYDSAYKYGKIAYSKIQNNLAHVGNYFQSIIGSNSNLEEAKLLFNDSKNFDHQQLWSSYVTLSYKNSETFNIDSTKSITSIAREKFPNDRNIKIIDQEFKYGIDNVITAINLDNRGRFNYENGFYQASYLNYLDASRLLPDEYSYFQNMAMSKIALGDYDKGLELLNYAIDSLVIPSDEVRIYSIRGGIKILQNNISEGCRDLIFALQKNDQLAKDTILQNCSQYITNIEYN